MRKAQSYHEAVAIWEHGDTIRKAIDQAAELYQVPVEVCYDDVIYYTADLYDAQSNTRLYVNLNPRQPTKPPGIPQPIWDLIRIHSNWYDEYYKDANDRF